MEIVKWPGTKDKDGSTVVIIPYEISDKLGSKAKLVIHQAIQDYTDFTCIRFLPRKKDEDDYIKFILDQGYVLLLFNKLSIGEKNRGNYQQNRGKSELSHSQY